MGQLNSFIEPRPNGANYGGYTYGLRRLYISKFKKPLLGRTGRGPTTTTLPLLGRTTGVPQRTNVKVPFNHKNTENQLMMMMMAVCDT